MDKFNLAYHTQLDNDDIHLSYEYLLSLIAEDLFLTRSLIIKNHITFDAYKDAIIGRGKKSKSIFYYFFNQAGDAIERNPDNVEWDDIESRVSTYQNVLNNISNIIKLPGFCFGIEYEDMAGDFNIPLLCFHKNIDDQSHILVPDFEIFEYNYYMQLKDGTDFDNKVDKAVFVGSTTGTNFDENRGCCNTVDNIINDPSVRISAAHFFNDKENIIFKLPSVVQCDNSETEIFLRNQPYMQAQRMTWDQQYQNRYIISIDGNGPTCTRVALSLLSNSVLMKYKSSWIVYYHRALRPYFNYLPVQNHGDIEHIMETFSHDLASLRFISGNAKRQFRLLFNRRNVQRMFAIALNELYAIFFGYNTIYHENRRRLSKVAHLDMDAHFSNVGDKQFWPDHEIYCGGQFIEGITIYPASSLIDWYNMEYQAKLEDGTITACANGGGFVGTKGQSLSLIAFRFLANPNLPCHIEYEGEFESGLRKTANNGNWLEHNNEKLKRITIKFGIIQNGMQELEINGSEKEYGYMINVLESLVDTASFRVDLPPGPTAWLGHIYFANWLTKQLKPEVLVELGTHAGHSYFAFCQTVSELNLSTKCYAVDTWVGDGITTGHYAETVFDQVVEINKKHSSFSTLLRMTFDQALDHIQDSSVSLLHIDGLHTYEAVSHDFQSWLPKLAPGAVVLFHDINVFQDNFGVHKLWSELKQSYPNNIEFMHSAGLGVLQLNDVDHNDQLAWLRPEFSERQRIIQYFSSLGELQQHHG